MVSLALVLVVVLPGNTVAYGPQGNYQNPVTAAPPVVPPPTSSCAVVLLHAWAFDNEIGQGSASGRYAPPSGCPGPWAMVVLNWSTSVRGVQFDRIGTLNVAGVQIFRTINAEPDPSGISWNVDKDVTEYTPILEGTHTFLATMNNYVTGPYTGILFVNATLTFYEPSSQFPAPPVPSAIVPVTNSTLIAGENSSVVLSSVPDNVSSATIEIYATGHSCDEFWYTNVPYSFLYNAYAGPNGLCGGTSLREVNVWVDGLFAGFALPFPYIYTGGINPYLWEPIPGVNDFNIAPYVLDLTPFAALLSDGQPQNITVGIWNNAGSWIVNSALFLTEQAGPTTGALTVRHASFEENVNSTIVNFTGSSSPYHDGLNISYVSLGGVWANFTTAAVGNFVASGYINTPGGRVTTTLAQRYDFANQENYFLTFGNSTESVSMSELMTATITTQRPGSTSVSYATEFYPLRVSAGFYIVAQGDLIPANVSMGYIDSYGTATLAGALVTTSGSSVLDLLTATSDWVYGSSLLPTAFTTETYSSLNANGAYYTHTLGAMNGFVVFSRVSESPHGLGCAQVPSTAFQC